MNGFWRYAAQCQELVAPSLVRNRTEAGAQHKQPRDNEKADAR